MENNLTSSVVAPSAKLYREIRCVNSKIGEYCCIGDFCDIDKTIMDDKSELGRHNILRSSIIGRGSYTGSDCIIKNVDIGCYTSIAWNVNIGAGNHPYNHVSMYTNYWFKRTFGIELPEDYKPNIAKTVIGNDVWIGMGVNILHGIHIGDGAIIGTGAVITKDVEPYSIVVGVPGVEVKKRFSDEVINLLLELKWWEWDEEKIKQNIEFLRGEPTVDKIRQLK